MIERFFAVEPQGGAVIVSIRCIPERLCRLPLVRAESKSACCDGNFASAFFDACIPDCEKVAVRTFDYSCVVVVVVVDRAYGVFGDYDVGDRAVEVGFCHVDVG